MGATLSIKIVIPGLVPGIQKHRALRQISSRRRVWMAGTSPAMTAKERRGRRVWVPVFACRETGMTAVEDYPRSFAPTAFSTAATMRAESASISASVRVFSRGWTVTSTATDFMPSGTPWPW
jgi:hypothetical protein